MTVSILNNSGNSSGANTGTSVFGNSASETSDMFTKLLVAQIQNQDPLSPTDPAQFVQQLTQLSQTESLQKLTDVTTASAGALSSLQVMALGAQVGSDLMITTKQVVLDGSTKVVGQSNLESASSSTKLVLTGSDNVRHEIDLGVLPPGPLNFSIDPAKLGLKAGTYAVELTTSTKEATSVDIQGRLNNVRLLATGGVQLNVSNVGNTGSEYISAFNGKSAATQSVL